MPNLSAAATTDADGKFTLTIPKQGEYILVAKAQRMVSENTEKYYWTVPIDADGQAKSVMLSNNNKTGLANLENLTP